MVCFLVIFRNLQNYKSLIFILGMMVVFSPLALTWLYTIYEDFAYITIRTVVFQVISLILLVMIVKKETDVNLYAFVTVFSNVGSNIFNYIHSKHYCDIRFTFNIDWKRHLKPIMVIFITSIAITIYVSSDITILGLLCGDYNVGLYSTSVKVYTLLKNGLVSILIVVQARLAFYIGTNDTENFQNLSNSVINLLILILLPIVSGVIVLNQEIIMILTSEAFIQAGMSMVILMVAIIFNIFAQFFNTCILMPYRKENAIFWLSISVAILNIILNFILIPRFAENAAAFTTLLAEAVTCIIEFLLVKQYIRHNKMFMSNLISAFMGCVAIGGISYLVHYLIDNKYLIVIATLLASIIVYFLVQILTRNSFLLAVLKSKKFFGKKKGVEVL